MSDRDAFGDRMKGYEMAEAGRRLMTDRIPVVARLDGKCFSGFTRGLGRPFDRRLSDLMVVVTGKLVEAFGAACGYTQSDEITLGWYLTDPKAQMPFDGRVQKLTSVLAASCSVAFNRCLASFVPEKAASVEAGKVAAPVFDCRAWNLPNLDEGANAFLWREMDATKNSISMAARAYYSHKELLDKSGPEMQDMLHAKGVNWNDYPAFFKRGSYVQRKKVVGRLSPEDLEALPPLHNARKNPDLEVERSVIETLGLPPLTRVRNRPEVLFLGADPVLEG